jgi:ATP-dependent protease Clp ATPase subunit
MSTAGVTGVGVERCSACGRSLAQVKRILPARAAAVELVICNRCVTECEQAIADAPTRIPGAAHSCAYCTKREDQVAVIVGVGSRKICDECVDAYRAELG